ncbi:MAG TPA: CotH kinase family protein, partial [Bacteroidia bacterium]|nr:CotH kinase family protein [Bacteroidia bacterium]
MIDMENFADYFIVETFIVNVDWLGSYTNNIKYWRTNDPVGRWRYMLWDADLSLGRNPMTGASTTNMLDRAINPTKSNPHSVMLKALLNNTGFRNYFVNRYCDLLNTIYLPDKFKKQADDLHDEMQPEMARHFQLWGNFDSLPQPYPLFYPLLGLSSDVPTWEQNIDTVKMFMDSRPYYAFNQLQIQFSLVQQVDVGLNVYPAGAGTIKLNTIYPESFPWSGIYMEGVPVTMTASPNTGYKFSHWQSPSLIASPNSNSSVTLNITHGENFTAYFELPDLSFDVYPNPFDETFTVYFQLPEEAQVSLKMFNALGQEVAEIISDRHFTASGTYRINVDAKHYSLTSGVYFIKYKTNEFSRMIKLVKVNH